MPGTAGCPNCAELRHRDNHADVDGHQALCARFGDTPAVRFPAAVNPFAARIVAALVTDEMSRLLTAPRTARTRAALLRLATETGLVSRHRVVAHPLCGDCAQPVPDGPEQARVVLAPARKTSPEAFHTTPAAELAARVQRTCVDPLTGVVAGVDTWLTPTAAGATARVPRAGDGRGGLLGHGTAGDFRSARLAALLRALERLTGARPRGRRAQVYASYREIADHAVDPTTLALLHRTPVAGRAGADRAVDVGETAVLDLVPALAMLADADPDAEPADLAAPVGPPTAAPQPTTWVWGYSFGRGEPVLVPEGCVYPDTGAQGGPEAVGCAVGACLAEAVLRGLLTVAERDAFLLTWYARLAVPQLALDAVSDRRITLLAEQVRHEFGYRVHAFDTTLEQGVPSCWVLAVRDEAAAGGSAPRARSRSQLAALCAAGAHPVPERALLRAVRELSAALPGSIQRHDHRAAAALLDAPELVRTAEDHRLLYGHPDALRRLDFLWQGPARPPARPGQRRPWPAHSDIAHDLVELVGRYLASGLDVIVVDQTGDELRAAGLTGVRVLVPGTVPLTFGHPARQLLGLPRLHTVPRLLGHPDRAGSAGEINPHPHPYPFG